MKYRIIYEPEARNDLIDLYEYITMRSDPDTALRYVERVEASCEALARFPTRGTAAYDVRRGLRITGFRKRVSIAFVIATDEVRIVRIMYGGRDLPGQFTTELSD